MFARDEENYTLYDLATKLVIETNNSVSCMSTSHLPRPTSAKAQGI
jgi:hypothetical protein